MDVFVTSKNKEDQNKKSDLPYTYLVATVYTYATLSKFGHTYQFCGEMTRNCINSHLETGSARDPRVRIKLIPRMPQNCP